MPDAAPALIELRLSQGAQLFNTLDPSPFNERDFDERAEAYVVGWARELPRDAPLSVRIQLPAEEAKRAEDNDLADAFCNYFGGRAQAMRRELRELFRAGRRYSLIGVAVLIVCLTASRLVGALNAPFAGVLEEGLVIVGWVANWKPIEVFLYDWQPLRRNMRLYERLAEADVKIEAA
jgi:hypothetical protein